MSSTPLLLAAALCTAPTGELPGLLAAPGPDLETQGLSRAASLEYRFDPSAEIRLGAFQDDDGEAPEGQDPVGEHDPADLSGDLDTQATLDELPLLPPPYGTEGTSRWRIHLGRGVDFSDNSNKVLFAGLAWTRFIADGLSLDFEVNGIYYDQVEEDAGGANVNVIMRWHFIMERKWTVYGDAGIGVQFTNDDVPNDGSEFNFTPQAGFGFTRDIGNDVRLMIGGRWQHVSNANLYDENPGRDSFIGYVGLSFAH